MQDNDAEAVTLEFRDDVAVVGLNRPQKRNALSSALIEALANVIEEANAKARVAIIHGIGTHFSAGLDLAQLVQRKPVEEMANSRRWHEIFDRIGRGPIPWLSAIHGAAVGGGMELAASTHIRIADEKAYFALPEGQRGIFVGGGGSVRISRLIGAARMMDMMLTGRVISAREAAEWNFLQYVTDEGGAVEKALELAAQIATNAPFSNYAVINVLPRMADVPHSDALFFESAIATIASDTPEAKQRLRDFLEKRTAKVAPPQERQ